VSSNGHIHVPILTNELLSLLALSAGDWAIDATVDGGGHAQALLAATAPTGRVLGIDRDAVLLDYARNRFASEIATGRIVLVHGSFANIGAIGREQGFTAVAAVVFDLGVSSYHFDLAGRGFSFRADEPLDMRFDPTSSDTPTAAQLLDRLTEREIASILFRYGEERYARRIARRIVTHRPIHTTSELFACVESALPGKVRWQAARSAARVFQALRIAVNNELAALETALPQAFQLLRLRGKLAVLSFHSLEDRIVKHFFRAQHENGFGRIVTKKPVRPSQEEVSTNPRAASAKLRVCERLG